MSVPSRRLELPAGYDFTRTVRPRNHDVTWHVTDGEIWRGRPTPDGSATVRLIVDGSTVEVRAWGDGADAALEQAPDLLGLNDDPTSFDPTGHPVVERAMKQSRGRHLTASRAIAEAAVGAIIGQRVTTGEAHRSWWSLLRKFGEPAPGPGEAMGLKVFPNPARLRDAGYSALHPLGIERGRAETIRGVCARADRLEAIAASSTSLEFDEMFQKFPGVGPWTSGVVRGGALGDPDAVIVGDLHLPHTITYALTGRERGTDDEMLELLEPFRGQRGRVQGLLAHSGTKPPRRAPRYRPLPIAQM